ncbi:MAG: hypothetical protein HYU78_15070 [Rhodocyclales bacterium]|nr:hypothetical protein [Rhodocyclales bacterium]
MRIERKQVPIDDVAPGSTLADEVCDASGHVLLPGGALITEAALASLRRRGVDQLWLAVPVRLDDAAQEAEVQRIEARLAYLFRDCGGNTAADDLKLRLLSYRRSQL